MTSAMGTILIFEPDPQKRDQLRAIVDGGVCSPVFFERESICFDNLHGLAPRLIVASAEQDEVVFRFLFAARLMEQPPALIFIRESIPDKDMIRKCGLAGDAVFVNRGLLKTVLTESIAM